MKYLASFSTINGKTTIHAMGCPSAAKKSGRAVWTVEADTPAIAAARVEASGDLEGRGFPFPSVCKCAKVTNDGPAVLYRMLQFR